MMEKLDVKTKAGMIYTEVVGTALILGTCFVKWPFAVELAVIAGTFVSMYVVDGVFRKLGSPLRKKYAK